MGGMDVAEWNADNPLHPRSGDGRFSIAGMVAKLIEGFGDVVAHDEIGERDHSLSDHGMISVHDSGHVVISRTDEDGPSVVASGLTGDYLGDLQQEIEDSLTELDKGLPPGTHLEWSADDPGAAMSPVTVGYGVTSAGHAYVSLTGAGDEDDSLQFSREHAEDLVTQIEGIRDQQTRHVEDRDNPFAVRALAPGENLEQRKGFTSDADFDLIAGLVSTPDGGHRLRLGLAGNDDYPTKRWTGGRGPMVADLGADEAAQLSDAIHEAELEIDDYVDRLGEALDIEAEWDQTPSGQRMAELSAEGWSMWSSARGLNVERHTGSYARGDAKIEMAPPEIDAEFRALHGELAAALDHIELVDEGDTFSTYEVETAWGTIRIDLLGNTLDYENPAEARFTIRPKGVDAEAWQDDVVHTHSARADYGEKKLAAIRKLVDAYVGASQAAGGELAKSAGSATDTPGAGRARALKRYWTRGKGLAKWVRSAHPWTTLRRHLGKYIHDPDKLDRITSQWFHDATGMWSGERKGKNPLGRG